MHSILRSVLGAAALVCVPLAQAAVLLVSPVRIQFEPTQPGQTLQISNRGQQAVDAQVRIMRWTQENGRDRLVPVDSSELVASPPMLHIEPGKQQTVRLIRLQPVKPAGELSYRLLVDELPRPDSLQGSGLRMLMRYSIPVFVEPVAFRRPAAQRRGAMQKTDLSRLHGQLAAGQDGKAELQMRNDGPQAVRISALSTVAPDGQARSVDGGLLGYVLAGQRASLPLSLAYPLPPGVSLKARFDDDTEAQAVPLDGAGR